MGNQLIAANSQAEADLVLSNARKIGIDTSMFEGKKFSPELKQQAYNMITTETDRLNNRINTIRANVDQAAEIRQQLKQKYKLKDNNDIATKAIRLCLERVRKLTGKSVKHWFITELGHEKTERLHLHGIVWGLENGKKITDNWKYGITFTGYTNF